MSTPICLYRPQHSGVSKWKVEPLSSFNLCLLHAFFAALHLLLSHCHLSLHPSPPPSSPSLHLASVVGDPLFDPLFSGGRESMHDRKADGGEPLISIETEEGLPGSSPSSKHYVGACECVLCACPSCCNCTVSLVVSLCSSRSMM